MDSIKLVFASTRVCVSDGAFRGGKARTACRQSCPALTGRDAGDVGDVSHAEGRDDSQECESAISQFASNRDQCVFGPVAVSSGDVVFVAGAGRRIICRRIGPLHTGLGIGLDATGRG